MFVGAFLSVIPARFAMVVSPVIAPSVVVTAAIAATVIPATVISAVVPAAAPWGPCSGLYVAFRLFRQRAYRQAQLTRFLINLEQFHVYLISDIQHIGDVVHPAPRQFGNMYHAFLSRKYFHESAKLKD
jgi:hypothetical protein